MAPRPPGAIPTAMPGHRICWSEHVGVGGAAVCYPSVWPCIYLVSVMQLVFVVTETVKFIAEINLPWICELMDLIRKQVV